MELHHLTGPLKIRGQALPPGSNRGYDIFLFDDLPPPFGTAEMEIRNLKFLFLYFPFLYFLLILNCQLSIIFWRCSLDLFGIKAKKVCGVWGKAPKSQ
jgi:hypothetical protein